ncbi:unnamed protein product [Brassica oleracea]
MFLGVVSYMCVYCEGCCLHSLLFSQILHHLHGHRDTPDGHLVEYQAKTEQMPWQNRAHGLFCRPTPKPKGIQFLNFFIKHYCLISVILPPIVMHLAAEATKHGTSIALMMNPSTNLQRECVPSKRKLNQCVFIDQR